MPHRLPHALRELVAAGQLLSSPARLLSSSPLPLNPSPVSALLGRTSSRFCYTGSSIPKLQGTSAAQPLQTKRQYSWPRMTGTEDSKEVRKYLQQSHDRIFENNKKWADEMKKKNPAFFEKMSAGQAPEYLWIGCSDSRIPAEAITGLEPGEMFIHRNIANLVCNIDLNVMSVVNYAVRHLKVKHIVVCGHYGCGGVKAAMTPKDMGLLNPWLRNIRDVYRLHQKELDDVIANGGTEDDKYNKLVELNVYEQCRNIIKTAAVQQSWAENEFPVVHGWVFGFHDGRLKDLNFDHEGQLKEIQKIYDLTKDL
ncbi:carbonic anhydrase [Bipolaris maydis]|nr:carbonic anhydrase [Bipolaris maydis]KAJ6269107.1 carbonic anhydrase [Bipolaris maydis]KAJ6279917.1 carbonic anhydrase [Bipolaris maydis]